MRRCIEPAARPQEDMMRRSIFGIGWLVFCALLPCARSAFAQADTPTDPYCNPTGADSPAAVDPLPPLAADDPADPDALARVKGSDAVTAISGGEVSVSGDHFVQDGRYYLMKGVNFKLRDNGWDMWDQYDVPAVRSRIDFELQRARDLRANVIRIFLTTKNFGGVPAIWGQQPIAFNDSYLTRLDDFLARADAKGLKVLVTFYDGINALDPDHGCRGGIGNPYPPYENASPDANSNTWLYGPDIRPFRNHADGVLTHQIPNTNRTFANDPRIFGWDVMNEPDHMYSAHPGERCPNAFYSQQWVNTWVAWMARHIKLYSSKPVTAGTYGWFLNPTLKDRYPINYPPATIQTVWNSTDFVSIHWYQYNVPAQNGDLDRALGCTQRAGKPIVLEEIGQADDGWDSCSQHHYMTESLVNTWTAEWTGIANNRGISGALVWSNYDFNPDLGHSPGRLDCGLTPNPPGNGNYFGMYNTDDSLKTTGVTFRRTALSPTCPRASFRTYDNVHYLKAETVYPRWLSAAGTAASHTAFTIVPNQAGGYYFSLLSPQGFYVSADNGGGGGIHVDKTAAYWWESFGIVPLQRLSANQWKVGLHAANNQYLSAANGGGNAVDANRNWTREWETFVMTCE
jgi:hypothetical protein